MPPSCTAPCSSAPPSLARFSPNGFNPPSLALFLLALPVSSRTQRATTPTNPARRRILLGPLLKTHRPAASGRHVRASMRARAHPPSQGLVITCVPARIWSVHPSHLPRSSTDRLGFNAKFSGSRDLCVKSSFTT